MSAKLRLILLDGVLVMFAFLSCRPRAVGSLMRSQRCFSSPEYLRIIRSACSAAEKDAGRRRTLISSLGDVDLRDEDLRTLLFYAEDWGCEELGNDLVAAGADVNSQDRYGLTTLHNLADLGWPLLFTQARGSFLARDLYAGGLVRGPKSLRVQTPSVAGIAGESLNKIEKGPIS